MSTVTLTKWGNSVGIRIPNAMVKEMHLMPGTELKIMANEKGGVTLIPIENPQENWVAAFNAIADDEQDELLIDLPNDFDEQEWTW